MLAPKDADWWKSEIIRRSRQRLLAVSIAVLSLLLLGTVAMLVHFAVYATTAGDEETEIYRSIPLGSNTQLIAITIAAFGTLGFVGLFFTYFRKLLASTVTMFLGSSETLIIATREIIAEVVSGVVQDDVQREKCRKSLSSVIYSWSEGTPRREFVDEITASGGKALAKAAANCPTSSNE